MSKKFKRIIGLLMMTTLVMGLGVTVWADAPPMPMLISAEPTLISVEPITTKVNFDVTYDKNNFTITLEENSSTGYAWTYEIKDQTLVHFISDENIPPEVVIPGAGGQHNFTFNINKDGVTTIQFDLKRSWETTSVETVTLLAYKNGDLVIVEEDQIVTICEEVPVQINEKIMTLSYNSQMIDLDVAIQDINGVKMIPVALILREMGYTVEWKEATNTVDIMKGAQFTTLTIDKNSYFKNKMAPWPLSAAPIVVDGRTLVPAEFFTTILGLGVQVSEDAFLLNDHEFAIHSGYIVEINEDLDGIKSIMIAPKKDDTDMSNMTVINVSNGNTIINKDLKVGEPIHAICNMMMTMSIPPQTPGYIIY